MQPGNRDALPAYSDTELVGRAGWFAESYEPRRGEMHFVATDRAALAAECFLDWRWKRAGLAMANAPAARLIEGLPPQTAAPRLIWHTGFCCSTLLAKALDAPGRNLSLCEPQILVDIANAGRAGLIAPERTSRISPFAMALLARNFAPGEQVTVKPAPAANILLRDLAGRTGRPMLFLYSDCRSFLLSVAKLGEDGRQYVRRAFLTSLGDGHAPAKWSPQQLFAMTDLEIAASVWHMQIAEIRQNWPRSAPAASLDCDTLLASPAETLNRIDEFLSLSLGSGHIERVLAGPLFRRNAKTGEKSFDAARRQEQHRLVAAQMGGDLERIVARGYELFPATPRGLPLTDPLLECPKRSLP